MESNTPEGEKIILSTILTNAVNPELNEASKDYFYSALSATSFAWGTSTHPSLLRPPSSAGLPLSPKPT